MAKSKKAKCSVCGCTIKPVKGTPIPITMCTTCHLQYGTGERKPKPIIGELVTKASQCSDLLVQDIREARSVACHKNPILGILLLSLLEDAVRIKQRLEEIGGIVES